MDESTEITPLQYFSLLFRKEFFFSSGKTNVRGSEDILKDKQWSARRSLQNRKTALSVGPNFVPSVCHPIPVTVWDFFMKICLASLSFVEMQSLTVTPLRSTSLHRSG